jgi:hypothetical protein
MASSYSDEENEAMSGHELDDDLAEADVTEDEFDRRIAVAESANIVSRSGIRWGTADAAVIVSTLGSFEMTESRFRPPGLVQLLPSVRRESQP